MVALSLAAAPSSAGADIRIHGRISGVPALAPGVGFALHLAREDLALVYEPDGDTEPLAVRRLGITLSEAVGARTRLGLRLGRLWSSQSGRAATDELDPEGHYLDVALSTERPVADGIEATLDASWRYAIAEADDDVGGETRLEWQALTIRPALRFALRERMAVQAGASLVALDGEERVRGAQASSADFESHGHVGGFIALELVPQPDDVVHLRLEGGPRTGVLVSFEHRY